MSHPAPSTGPPTSNPPPQQQQLVSQKHQQSHLMMTQGLRTPLAATSSPNAAPTAQIATEAANMPTQLNIPTSSFHNITPIISNNHNHHQHHNNNDGGGGGGGNAGNGSNSNINNSNNRLFDVSSNSSHHHHGPHNNNNIQQQQQQQQHHHQASAVSTDIDNYQLHHPHQQSQQHQQHHQASPSQAHNGGGGANNNAAATAIQQQYQSVPTMGSSSSHPHQKVINVNSLPPDSSLIIYHSWHTGTFAQKLPEYVKQLILEELRLEPKEDFSLAQYTHRKDLSLLEMEAIKRCTQEAIEAKLKSQYFLALQAAQQQQQQQQQQPLPQHQSSPWLSHQPPPPPISLLPKQQSQLAHAGSTAQHNSNNSVTSSAQLPTDTPQNHRGSLAQHRHPCHSVGGTGSPLDSYSSAYQRRSSPMPPPSISSSGSLHSDNNSGGSHQSHTQRSQHQACGSTTNPIPQQQLPLTHPLSAHHHHPLAPPPHHQQLAHNHPNHHSGKQSPSHTAVLHGDMMSTNNNISGNGPIVPNLTNHQQSSNLPPQPPAAHQSSRTPSLGASVGGQYYPGRPPMPLSKSASPHMSTSCLSAAPIMGSPYPSTPSGSSCSNDPSNRAIQLQQERHHQQATNNLMVNNLALRSADPNKPGIFNSGSGLLQQPATTTANSPNHPSTMSTYEYIVAQKKKAAEEQQSRQHQQQQQQILVNQSRAHTPSSSMPGPMAGFTPGTPNYGADAFQVGLVAGRPPLPQPTTSGHSLPSSVSLHSSSTISNSDYQAGKSPFDQRMSMPPRHHQSPSPFTSNPLMAMQAYKANLQASLQQQRALVADLSLNLSKQTYFESQSLGGNNNNTGGNANSSFDAGINLKLPIGTQLSGPSGSMFGPHDIHPTVDSNQTSNNHNRQPAPGTLNPTNKSTASNQNNVTTTKSIISGVSARKSPKKQSSKQQQQQQQQQQQISKDNLSVSPKHQQQQNHIVFQQEQQSKIISGESSNAAPYPLVPVTLSTITHLHDNPQQQQQSGNRPIASPIATTGSSGRSAPPLNINTSSSGDTSNNNTINISSDRSGKINPSLYLSTSQDHCKSNETATSCLDAQNSVHSASALFDRLSKDMTTYSKFQPPNTIVSGPLSGNSAANCIADLSSSKSSPLPSVMTANAITPSGQRSQLPPSTLVDAKALIGGDESLIKVMLRQQQQQIQQQHAIIQNVTAPSKIDVAIPNIGKPASLSTTIIKSEQLEESIAVSEKVDKSSHSMQQHKDQISCLSTASEQQANVKSQQSCDTLAGHGIIGGGGASFIKSDKLVAGNGDASLTSAGNDGLSHETIRSTMVSNDQEDSKCFMAGINNKSQQNQSQATASNSGQLQQKVIIKIEPPTTIDNNNGGSASAPSVTSNNGSNSSSHSSSAACKKKQWIKLYHQEDDSNSNTTTATSIPSAISTSNIAVKADASSAATTADTKASNSDEKADEITLGVRSGQVDKEGTLDDTKTPGKSETTKFNIVAAAAAAATTTTTTKSDPGEQARSRVKSANGGRGSKVTEPGKTSQESTSTNKRGGNRPDNDSSTSSATDSENDDKQPPEKKARRMPTRNRISCANNKSNKGANAAVTTTAGNSNSSSTTTNSANSSANSSTNNNTVRSKVSRAHKRDRLDQIKRRLKAATSGTVRPHVAPVKSASTRKALISAVATAATNSQKRQTRQQVTKDVANETDDSAADHSTDIDDNDTSSTTTNASKSTVKSSTSKEVAPATGKQSATDTKSSSSKQSARSSSGGTPTNSNGKSSNTNNRSASANSSGKKKPKLAADKSNQSSGNSGSGTAISKSSKEKPSTGSGGFVVATGNHNNHQNNESEIRRTMAIHKRNGETFLQKQSCVEVDPDIKVPRCLECRQTRFSSSNSKSDKSISSKQRTNWGDFCRFYEFRKLKYKTPTQLVTAGFSEPIDAEEADELIWSIETNHLPANINEKVAKFIIDHIGDQFCDLVMQERDAKALYTKHREGSPKPTIWKRAVHGVREMCDVCATTLFNRHFGCEKCGFVVCIDCYKTKALHPSSNDSSNSARAQEGSPTTPPLEGQSCQKVIDIKSESKPSLDDISESVFATSSLEANTNSLETPVTTISTTENNTPVNSSSKNRRDSFNWISCAKNRFHSHKSLVLIQIIAGDSLDQIWNVLHKMRSAWSPNNCCKCDPGRENQEPDTQDRLVISLPSASATVPAAGNNKQELSVNQSNNVDQSENLKAANESKLSSANNLGNSGSKQQKQPTSGDDDDDATNHSTLRGLLLEQSLPTSANNAGPTGTGPNQLSPSAAEVGTDMDGSTATSTPKATEKTDQSSKDAASPTTAPATPNPDEPIKQEKTPQPQSATTDGSSSTSCNNQRSSTKGSDHSYYWCDGDLLVLLQPKHKDNLKLFKSQWKLGKPVIVRGIDKLINMDLWVPSYFSEKFGFYRNDLIDCRDDSVHKHSMKKYWDGFEQNYNQKKNQSNRKQNVSSTATNNSLSVSLNSDENSASNSSFPNNQNSSNNNNNNNNNNCATSGPLWKMKDWPPSEDFAEILPDHYRDYMENLPLSIYTTRNGQLNLACRIPNEMLRPDLGPKLYSAYGSTRFSNRGTTNLHLDMSDAINVMMYVGGAKAYEDGSVEQQELYKDIIDNCDIDLTMKNIIRENNGCPGAIWHIFKPSDALTLRVFLNKIAEERNISSHLRSDPIHDQIWYLDPSLRKRLWDEHGVKPFSILQCMGDAIIIPAGAPHQVKNLNSCIKVAQDFVSPENVDQCFKLTREFRKLPETHINHEDKLQIKNIVYHAVKDSLRYLQRLEQSSD